MALFKKLTDEEKVQKHIGRYLLDGEIVVKNFDIKRKNIVYITNVRVIVINNLPEIGSQIPRKGLSFIPIKKIDSVSILECETRFYIEIMYAGSVCRVRYAEEDEDFLSLLKELSNLTLQ